jgi:hypothetical protein
MSIINKVFAALLLAGGIVSSALLQPADADGPITIFLAAGQLPATGTNDTACATCLGFIASSSVVSGSAVSLTTATPANMTSLSLAAGDWDCYAQIVRKLAATTSVTLLKSSISTTSATDGNLATGTMAQFSTAANVMLTDHSEIVGPVQISIASTTTVFAVADDTFTVSTNAAYGQLRCRRAR